MKRKIDNMKAAMVAAGFYKLADIEEICQLEEQYMNVLRFPDSARRKAFRVLEKIMISAVPLLDSGTMSRSRPSIRNMRR